MISGSPPPPNPLPVARLDRGRDEGAEALARELDICTEYGVPGAYLSEASRYSVYW